MSRFWWNWLMIWCGAVGLFGAFLLLGAFEATAGPVARVYAILGPGVETRFDPAMRFNIGLLGAVTLGWAATLVALIWAAERLGPRGGPAWSMLTVGVIGWYVIDSSISVETGFMLNAVSNTGFLIAYLIPILRTGVLARGAPAIA